MNYLASLTVFEANDIKTEVMEYGKTINESLIKLYDEIGKKRVDDLGDIVKVYRSENGMIKEIQSIIDTFDFLNIFKNECQQCKEYGGGFSPDHDGSSRCESGSIASGGNRAHCTCSICF